MNVALIEFTKNGKKYYFKIPTGIVLNNNDMVIVETVQGVEIGKVYNLKQEDDQKLVNKLKPVLRLANDNDLNNFNQNNLDQVEVIKITKDLISQLNLDMIVLDAVYTLNRDKLTIFFKAEQRIDFRELVKELNTIYRTRIELRQIGPRDVAKIIGGLGPCGLVLCCSNFIGEFDTVTIRMAKNQELSLSPRNISGICGKLLCCLKYEDEVYEELKSLMPDLGKVVNSEKGRARVIDINFISKLVKLKYFEEDYSEEWLDYRLLKE